MMTFDTAATGRFCWLDLAATDADRAKTFYREMFGWTADEQAAGGGLFTLLRQAGQDIGSIYQLNRAHLEHGVPSHWTPYVRVDGVEAAAARAAMLGGEIIVNPFTVPGVARIALIVDAVGATVGLWEPLPETQAPEPADTVSEGTTWTIGDFCG